MADSAAASMAQVAKSLDRSSNPSDSQLLQILRFSGSQIQNPHIPSAKACQGGV